MHLNGRYGTIAALQKLRNQVETISLEVSNCIISFVVTDLFSMYNREKTGVFFFLDHLI